MNSNQAVRLGDGEVVGIGAIVYRRPMSFLYHADSSEPMILIEIWPGPAEPSVACLARVGGAKQVINPFQLRFRTAEDLTRDAELISLLQAAFAETPAQAGFGSYGDQQSSRTGSGRLSWFWRLLGV